MFLKITSREGEGVFKSLRFLISPLYPPPPLESPMPMQIAPSSKVATFDKLLFFLSPLWGTIVGVEVVWGPYSGKRRRRERSRSHATKCDIIARKPTKLVISGTAPAYFETKNELKTKFVISHTRK